MALMIDYQNWEEDTIICADYQVEAAVKRLLNLPHLPDALTFYGVSETVAYLVALTLAGRVDSSIVWDKGHLLAIVTLQPPVDWLVFREAFLVDTYNAPVNSVCSGCLRIPDLAADMLFCRQCSAGAFCSACYDLSLERCVRCPEDVHGTSISSNLFRMRKYWLMQGDL